jgi:hypothetical protein
MPGLILMPSELIDPKGWVSGKVQRCLTLTLLNLGGIWW